MLFVQSLYWKFMNKERGPSAMSKLCFIDKNLRNNTKYD